MLGEDSVEERVMREAICECHSASLRTIGTMNSRERGSGPVLWRDAVKQWRVVEQQTRVVDG